MIPFGLAALAIRFHEAARGPLPPWDSFAFGEAGFGPGALPWDGRFRSLNEFATRWEQILTATSRAWVNLRLTGVEDGRLLVMVEYTTDDRANRTWPNDAVSIN